MLKKSWKNFIFLGIAFAVFIVLTNLVSAQETSSSGVFGGIQSVFKDVLKPFVNALLFSGGETATQDLFLEKLLFFTISLLLIFLILGRIEMFKENRSIKMIITISVSILITKFMPVYWLDVLLKEYSILSMVFAYFLTCSPFLIFFYVLHQLVVDSSILRKAAWCFFIAVYVIFWLSAETNLSVTLSFWIMVAAFLAMIFDRKIHKIYMQYAKEIEKAKTPKKSDSNSK